MNQDHELTSERLEKTLKQLREGKYIGAKQLFNPVTGTWGVAFEGGTPMLVAASYHIRHYITPGMEHEDPQVIDAYGRGDGTRSALYTTEQLLDYFQNLKRLRNLRALID